MLEDDHFELNQSRVDLRIYKLEGNQEEANRSWTKFMENLERLSNRFKSKKCECSRFLIVDDNEFNLLAMLKYFEQLKIRAEVASNGSQALDKVQQRASNLCCNSFSLVFMDCDMPVMNGYQASLELTKQSQAGKIPKTLVVACTAYITEEEIQKCYESGMVDYIRKPVEKKALYELILKWLEN